MLSKQDYVGKRYIIMSPNSNRHINTGNTGRCVAAVGGSIGLEFDNFIDGHSCEGAGIYGYCWWFDLKEVTEVAQIREVIGIGVAECALSEQKF